jgi:aminoglycoside phosphotransferase (APT) family kinase protein
LVAALARTPSTFIHGDWKLGNIGEHANGRTILLDWDRSGYAPATLDLAWYVGVNCDRFAADQRGDHRVVSRRAQRARDCN